MGGFGFSIGSINYHDRQGQARFSFDIKGSTGMEDIFLEINGERFDMFEEYPEESALGQFFNKIQKLWEEQVKRRNMDQQNERQKILEKFNTLLKEPKGGFEQLGVLESRVIMFREWLETGKITFKVKEPSEGDK